MRVVDLRAEHVIGLLGTEEARPRLSWRIESDARGAVQTHYRIRAAASPEALAADDLLWDSGRVASGALLDIAWDGPALAAMQRDWWDVEVNDAARTDPEWCEKGLAAPEDRRGEWSEAGAAHAAAD